MKYRSFLACCAILLIIPLTGTAIAQPSQHIPIAYIPSTTCVGCLPVTGFIGLLVDSGNIHLINGQYAAAMACYDIALQNDPKNIMALIGKGYVFEKWQKYDEAVTYFDKALKIYPNNAYAVLLKEDSLYYEAVDLVKHGKYQEAATYYGLVMKMDPKFVLTESDLDIIHKYIK